ncbi:hypothetical protein [Micromonospora sp. NPDC049497]|uniref:hypothetical protein n=1 Tax=Micromonospora sp. NPDC049497 TaxID=3364273 RepID=UPI0037983A1E
MLPGAALHRVEADGHRLVYALESAGVAEVMAGLAGLGAKGRTVEVRPGRRC